MLFSLAILFRLSPFFTVYVFTAGVSAVFSVADFDTGFHRTFFVIPAALLFLFPIRFRIALFNPEGLTDFQLITFQMIGFFISELLMPYFLARDARVSPFFTLCLTIVSDFWAFAEPPVELWMGTVNR